ncbi:hypothetical protein TPHA_0G03570 [Tetrapisispora phaffii CBS 4417]|uniref:Uncharacterized protein n=1 Tax=Tetrapisispora phaffii (strain ATCC 24235 / CBS 4417 / NBRC 1672 / NRRL Y-8282 / UCD 70-5) TaxID=1071381 RepID=G8BWB9_TETPH|nr:hypothetical protein TPHA_0G03570 [Tetrapisispora phaffii CBS 4417]CCE64197.1 hypothetical protein TPHA_0G03570 [Tetrapisispora phaffii CBS 4417]
MSSSNSQAFREIRQLCVAVSKFAFVENKDFVEANSGLIDALRALNSKLNEFEYTDLSPKFADYVFVPIASLLKQLTLGILETEYVLSIITHLLRLCWFETSTFPKDLAKQLFPVLTFLIGKDTKNEALQNMSDHYRSISLKTLHQFFNSLKNQRDYCNTFFTIENKEILPSLGHSITIILDILKLSENNPESQLIALDSLNILFKDIIADGEVLSFVLPGNLSVFASILAKPGMTINYNIIISTLKVMRLLLVLVYDDYSLKVEKYETGSLEKITELIDDDLSISPEELFENQSIVINEDKLKERKVHRTTNWLHATSSQVKRFLNSFLPKLVKRKNESINKELDFFASDLLLNCRLSLSVCASELISVLLDIRSSNLLTLGIDMTLLTKIVEEKISKITEIVKFEKLQELKSLEYGLLVLDQTEDVTYLISRAIDALIDVLDDNEIQYRMRREDIKIVEKNNIISLNNMTFNNLVSTETTLLPSLSKEVEFNLSAILTGFGSMLSKNNSLIEEVERIFDTSNNRGTLALWVATNLSSNMENCDTNSDLNLFLDFKDSNEKVGSSEAKFTILEQSYELNRKIAMEIENNGLNKKTENDMCIILNSITVVSNSMKGDFESELIDYLYIVIDSLASSSSLVRERAQICATVLADNLYGGSVTDLIVTNVDYLVESISSRLNLGMTQRVSTILMVICNLSGYKIITNFTDVIETIFKLLEYYHGYSDLCLQFFQLFEVITLEMKKEYLNSNLENHKLSNEHLVTGAYAPWGISSVQQILYVLDKDTDPLKEEEFDGLDEPKNFQEYFDSKLREADSDDELSEGEENIEEELKDGGKNENPEDDAEKWISPIPRDSYRILLKIIGYSDRLLTHPSKPLKIQVLSVIKLIVPMLDTQHDSLLPQVAKIWDVLIACVLDSDFSITQAACECVKVIITHSKDFITKRFIELWTTLKDKSTLLRSLYLSRIQGSDSSTKLNEHPSIEVVLHQKFPPVTRRALISLSEMLIEGICITEMVLLDSTLIEMVYCCIQVIPKESISSRSLVLGDAVWTIVNKY